jgi:hypothetical protein
MDGVHRHTPLFNSLIHFYELRELTMTGGSFTWSNNLTPRVLEKLDRILMSTMKAIVANHSNVHAKAIWVSKHVQRKYPVKTCLYQAPGEYLELMTKVQ